MDKLVYVMLIERGKTYNKINKAMVIKHVEYIKKLDDDGMLVLAGATKGFPGVGGMVILKTESQEEAEAICKSEPFVAEGYATYKLFSMRVGNRDNNYLLQNPIRLPMGCESP
jgi:uncharacterized protein YciI